MKRNEAYLQSECVKWFRLQYPKYSLLLCSVPNGGSRHILEAANLKRQGVVAGTSDLILFIPNKEFHAMCIEMKFGKGKQSEHQKEWQEAVESQGYKYVVCRSVDEFISEVRNYLS